MAEHTHWKQLVNQDYLGAYALVDGADMDLTIKSVDRDTIVGTGGKREEVVIAHMVENVKPMILNRTNLKSLTKLFKTPYIDEWCGKRFTVYATTTKLAGEVVECLRIRPTAPTSTTPKKIVCTDCGATVNAAGGMTAQQVADYAKQKLGRVLCANCIKKASAAKKGDEA